MFSYASAFNQDLGWCVDDGVSLSYAFDNTPCASTSCGVVQVADVAECPTPALSTTFAPTFAPPPTTPAPTATPAPTVTPLVADDTTIRTAVAAWLSDASAAEATYGHISTWDTSGVTSMDFMFFGASAFNQDIGDWAVDSVTSMDYMFYSASSFNQDLGGWAVDGVTSMD